jgi:biotin transport system substrate-specific component
VGTIDGYASVRHRILERIEHAEWVETLLYVTGFALLTAALAQVRFYAPWNPYVPYTGQVLGVVASGLVLGSRRGSASMIAYLGFGAVGLPVFADYSAGIDVLLGATAGYLYAYPVAAGLVGWLSRRYLEGPDEETLARLGLAALGGYVALFGVGAFLLGVSDVVATQGLGRTVLVSSLLVVGVGGLLWRWSRKESQAFLARMATGLVGVVAIYALGWIGLATATGMGWGPALAQGVIQFVPVDLAKVFVAAGATGALLPPREG